MGEKPSTSNTHQIASNSSEWWWIWLRMTSAVQFCNRNLLIGQLRSNDDVIRSIHVYPYNFWLEWDRDMGWVPQCSSCQDASFNMKLDLFRSLFRLFRSLFRLWLWPRVTRGQSYQVTFPGHKVYESIRLDERKMMVAKSAFYLK